MRSSRSRRSVRLAALCLIVSTALRCAKGEPAKSITIPGEGTYTTGKGAAAAFENFVRSYVSALSSACDARDSASMCLIAEFCETVDRAPIDRWIRDPEIRSISESIKAGRSAFNEANAKQYSLAFEKWGKVLAAGAPDDSAEPAPDELLNLPLLTGVQKEGDPCYFSDECDRGLLCNLVRCPGRCEVLPAAGEPCLPEAPATEQRSVLSLATSDFPEVDLCDALSRCDDTSRLCVARKAQGESCADSDECVRDLYCRSGKCVPLRITGDPCVELVDRCNRGLTCREGACRPPGKEGEACSEDSMACASGLICRVGACRPPGAEGEPCGGFDEDLGGAQCRTGLHCNVQGKCAAPLAAGSECRPFDICKGYCDIPFRSSKGTCRDAYPSAGEACGSEGECGLCSECDPVMDVCMPVGIGASCRRNADCPGGGLKCDPATSRCVLLPVLGESCDRDVGCSSDFYCGADEKCRAAGRFRYESCAGDSHCVSDDCEGRLCAGGPCRPPELPEASP